MPNRPPNPFSRNDLQPKSALPERSTPTPKSGKRGRPRIDYPAILSPTIGDIREAAGFYEGEGCFNKSTIQLAQNDKEKLDWLVKYFGGKAHGPYVNKSTGNTFYVWMLYRERALGFMFTIFTFLSKSRREQFKNVLLGKGGKRDYKDWTSVEYISKQMQRSKRKIVRDSMSLFGVRK